MKTPILKFSRAKFKAWLQKQKPSRQFNYVSNEHCLFASFAKEALGFPDTAHATTYGVYRKLRDDKYMKIPYPLSKWCPKNRKYMFTVAEFMEHLKI